MAGPVCGRIGMDPARGAGVCASATVDKSSASADERTMGGIAPKCSAVGGEIVEAGSDKLRAMSDALALSDLCSGCGLCCIGWIDGSVRLSADDIQRLPATVQRVEKSRGAALLQPCACHGGGECRIYEQRPLACRQFKCLSFAAVERGEITIDEARGRIAAAVEATRAIAAALAVAAWTEPGEGGPDAWRRFTVAMRAAGDDPIFRRRYADVLLTIAAYERLAERVLVHDLVVE